MALRTDFPPPGSDYMGGTSDGWEYCTSFAGTTLEQSYDMLRQFLAQEGYQDIPLPKDAEELDLFREPPSRSQINLFIENGYSHNPVKIKFHKHRRKRTTLILCLYNELVPGHLVRFHEVVVSGVLVG